MLFSRLMTLVCLIICLAGLSTAYADDSDDNTGRDETQTYPITDEVTMLSAVHFSYAKPKIVIKAVTPTLDYTDNNDIFANFNDSVTDFVKQESSLFRDLVASAQGQQIALAKNRIKNNLYIDYDTSVVKPNGIPIISIRFSIQGDIAGLPHPFHYHRVLNYDLEVGEKIELADLFKADADYLQVLSDYTSMRLIRHFSDKQLVLDGTAPKPENFKNWNIKANGLLITFDEYQVAPYINGTQSILVPYSALKNIISPDSPLSACVKNPRKCARGKVLTGGFIDTAAIKPMHRAFNPLLSQL